MLVWIGVAAFLAVAVVDVRWLVEARHARRWRLAPRGFPWLRSGSLGVVAAVALVPTGLRWHEEHRLSAAASVLAGTPVTVHCQTFGETFTDLGAELGYVRFGADGVPEHHTVLKHDPCSDLRHYLGGDRAHPSADEIVAVHVLTHESMHMRGLAGEAQAECAAVQRDAVTARLLGATEPQARALEMSYWRTVYPEMSTEYRSNQCGPGGTLDEHLPDPPWTPDD